MKPPSSEPGQYASVNGLQLYYEIHGEPHGKVPLVLLHGGVGGIAMFGPNLPTLAQGRRIIAVELQGHGRTVDIDRPLRYEHMADDIAALLVHLNIQRADIMGYSLGGGVALQIAFRHPERVRRLVIISRQIKSSGFFPEVQAAFEHMGPESGAMLEKSPLAQMYPQVNWRTLFAKVGEMERMKYDWSANVSRISAPILLVFADADSVTPAHILEFWQLLGGGQRDAGLDGSLRPPGRELAIMPGTTHYNVLATDAVARLAIPFLDTP
ncbi:MAG TPA: alpha/beta hydrolase [Gemmatimonadaceae bacterium]|jgi:pimeloyl-ACP methyl ester carboxylesterase